MGRFETALQLVFHAEGGLANVPGDRGGLTKYGVTNKTYQSYRRLVSDPALPRSVRDITVPIAADVYRRLFWDQCSAGACELPLAVVVFDMAVNSGPETAKRYLQRALGVPEDGEIGPQTLAALHVADQKEVAFRYLDLRWGFYEAIIRRDRTQAKFRRGWLNRLEHLRQWLSGLSEWEKVT
jgi:lysozyme family protein